MGTAVGTLESFGHELGTPTIFIDLALPPYPA